MSQKYDCLLCEKQGMSGIAFSYHVPNEHKITVADYFLNLILKKESKPVCLAKGYNNELIFKGMSRGFGSYCSNPCKIYSQQDRFMEERDKYVKSDTHREQARKQAENINSDSFLSAKRNKASSETFKRMHQEIPEKVSSWTSKNMSKLNQREDFASERDNRLRNLIKFKTEHEGMGYWEYLLWNVSQFRKLDPIPQYRGFQDRKVGPILDFYIEKYNLNIEIDGSWGHSEEGDLDRDCFLKSTFGVITIRATNKEVEENVERIMSKIYDFILSIEEAGITTGKPTDEERKRFHSNRPISEEETSVSTSDLKGDILVEC